MSEAGPAFAGEEHAGFWIVLILSIVLGAIAIAFLRRIRWI